VAWPWDRGGENKQSARLKALEEAVEGLESRQRLIKVEWESVLDKVNAVMGRLNARIRKTEAASTPETDFQEAYDSTGPKKLTGSHGTLSEMRRRRGLLPG